MRKTGHIAVLCVLMVLGLAVWSALAERRLRQLDGTPVITGHLHEARAAPSPGPPPIEEEEPSSVSR